MLVGPWYPPPGVRGVMRPSHAGQLLQLRRACDSQGAGMGHGVVHTTYSAVAL